MPIVAAPSSPSFRPTPGLYRAMTRGGILKVHTCGFVVPRYRGAYPKRCPVCQGDLKDEVTYPSAENVEEAVAPPFIDHIAGAKIVYQGAPPSTDDPDDEDGYEYAKEYFSVGHGEDEFGGESHHTRNVVYYFDGRELHTSIFGKGEHPGTHGTEFSHDVANLHYKGRYELDTGRLTLSPPSGKWDVPMPDRIVKAVIAKFNEFAKEEDGKRVKEVVVVAPSPHAEED